MSFSLCLFVCVCVGMRIRSLNELRVLLLESPRHSAGVDWDLSREVHRAEWRMKEQKLQDDIKTLREKLLLLVRPMGRNLQLQLLSLFYGKHLMSLTLFFN